MLRKLWLMFAQTATVMLAVLFVVSTLRPDWLPRRRGDVVNVAPSNPAPPSDVSPSAVSYASAARSATPSVVNIYTSKQVRMSNSPFGDDPVFKRFFGDAFGDRAERSSSLGSGVIVSAGGYVLTNNHVVEAADQIEVALADGRRASAKVVGADPETDLAVVKVDLSGLDKKALPAITFAKAEQVRVGDVVLAIGNPFGFGSSVSMGIVSATGRTHLGINTFENFIQTDAAINPGNSGGALVDVNGNLVGINTAILSRTGTSAGIGFAIPSDTAKQILDSIVETGQVIRGYVGVETQDVTPELAEAFGLSRKQGAIIAGVVRGGPADKAGVKAGDILVSVNDMPITDSSAMLNLVAQLKPGASARIAVSRDGKDHVFLVQVGRRPKVVVENQ